VIDAVIVAALGNGNDTVSVIDTVDDRWSLFVSASPRYASRVNGQGHR